MSQTKLNNSDINYNTDVPWDKIDTSTFPSATTSVEWIVEMATDAEASTGTDEERYINSKQLWDKVATVRQTDKYYEMWASSNVLASNLTEIACATTDLTWQTKKSFTVKEQWTYQVSFTMTKDASNSNINSRIRTTPYNTWFSNATAISQEMWAWSESPWTVYTLNVTFPPMWWTIFIDWYWNNSYPNWTIKDAYVKWSLTASNFVS